MAMRRSLREAAVGLSILAALAAASGLWLRLRGHQFFGSAWTVTVRLDNGAGLVSRSSVLYRGVDVGTVQSITPEPDSVAVAVQFRDAQLVIPQPVRAQVVTGSVLGGAAKLMLTGSSNPLPAATSPTAKDCPSAQQLCAGDVLRGSRGPTLDAAMARVTTLLDRAIDLELLDTLDLMAKTLIVTSNSITTAANDTGTLMQSLDDLAQRLGTAVDHVNTSAANITKITGHLANASAELDRPETIALFRQTLVNVEHSTDQLRSKASTILGNVERFTAHLDEIGTDILGITGDPAVTEGLRNLTVGLGLLFEDLYGAERLAHPQDGDEDGEP